MTETRIPFDLERALAGDPVVTRDNCKVTHLHVVPHWMETENGFNVFFKKEGCDVKFECNSHGNLSNTHESEYDLFMEPKIKTYWVNIYKNPMNYHMQTSQLVYDIKEEALKNKLNDPRWKYIKTISFEVEE